MVLNSILREPLLNQACRRLVSSGGHFEASLLQSVCARLRLSETRGITADSDLLDPRRPREAGSIPAQVSSEHTTVAFSASKAEAHLPYVGSPAGTSPEKGRVEVLGEVS